MDRTERCLDDLVSRIAMETQEITELEQQLTNAQILVNEALQKDLKEIISGLRSQTSRPQREVQSLQAENQRLQRHLEDAQRHCRRLEERAAAQTKEMCSLQTEVDWLRDRQVQMEAELQHLRAGLNKQLSLGQSDRHQSSLLRLKLQELRRVTSESESESLNTEHLLQAVEQLRELTCTVDALKSVSSGWTRDSGLDLLSSPERAPPTGATGHSVSETGAAGGAVSQEQRRNRLRLETKRLQRALQKHGCVLGVCFRRVLGVCGELWCVENTLLKRGAELREAQRRLQDAHSRVSRARSEAAEWERRANHSATCVQRTELQLRKLQALRLQTRSRPGPDPVQTRSRPGPDPQRPGLGLSGPRPEAQIDEK